jgi:hypothetical protein
VWLVGLAVLFVLCFGISKGLLWTALVVGVGGLVGLLMGLQSAMARMRDRRRFERQRRLHLLQHNIERLDEFLRRNT